MSNDAGMDAARWRRLDADLRASVEEYERARQRWLSASTSGEYVQAEAEMNERACGIAGYLALALQVRP